jgi:hypothetical protein
VFAFAIYGGLMDAEQFASFSVACFPFVAPFTAVADAVAASRAARAAASGAGAPAAGAQGQQQCGRGAEGSGGA